MSTKNRSEIRLGTIVRALLGSALIGTLGFLWILQSRAHQRLQDQISQIRTQCTVQELRLGLTNIAYRQVIHVTNQAPGSTPSLELSRNNTHPTAPAPPIAVAIPR